MEWNDYKKEYIVWYHNVRTGRFYDITNAVKNIEISTYVDGTPGKLTCDLINVNNLEIELGGTITVNYGEYSATNGTYVYFGFIFYKTYSDTNNQMEQLVCYDHLRYFKNTFTLSTSGKTLEDVALTLCLNFHIPLYFKDSTNGYLLKEIQYTDETASNILQECIKDIQTYTQEQYIIRDEFGVVFLENIRSLGKNYHLKYGESIIHYTYETEIDNNTYNVVESVYGELNGKTLSVAHKVVAQDNESMMLYGYLKKTQDVTGWYDNVAQITASNNFYADTHRSATINIQLDTVGVPELKAGDLIFITLPVGNNEQLTVKLIANGESLQMTPTTTDNDFVSYRGDMTFLVKITECTHKIDAGETVTTMKVTPMNYELVNKDFVDEGWGYLTDTYEENRKKIEELRTASNVLRP